tara:strand:+ start:1491 stop:1700 length:210 start_codon:yes stop_codon:yes gene_type:complete
MSAFGVEHSVFSDEAKAGIFQHSKGILSEINALCFDLLIYATATSKEIIEPSMLDVVIHNRRAVPQNHE